jgi:predicted RNase H-like nuclease
MSAAGIDGCRGGWITVNGDGASVSSSIQDAIAALPRSCVIALDMPIGLLDAHVAGGRECDRAIRTILGPARNGSVFSPPPRLALGCRTLPEAQARGARITLQTLNILPKIEEVDAVMTPALQRRIHEVHPELAFMAMNHGTAIAEPKRSAEGRAIRIGLLEAHAIAIPSKPRGAAMDDLLDACALAWSAHRIAAGTNAQALPRPPRDACGLAMQVRW